MRVVFFGTSEFGIPSLRLLRERNELVAAITTPDARAGRGQSLQPSPIRVAATALNVPVLTPESPNQPDFIAQLQSLAPDLIVLAAYRFILKPDILRIPALGCLNIHPSLLPRYRGAAPIQRALMNGEASTGISVFLMNEKIDQGDVILQREVQISPNENSGELAARLAELGAELLPEVLARIRRGDYQRIPQPEEQASYAPKIRKEERVINWQEPATHIHNLIRALAPVPGAYTNFRGARLEILGSELLPSLTAAPGELRVENRRLVCGTAHGGLVLTRVRPEGGKAMTGTDLCNGRRIKSGEFLGQQ